MPAKPRSRPSSANRQTTRRKRRSSSLTARSSIDHVHPSYHGTSALLTGIDLRTIDQKVEDLQIEINETKADSTNANSLSQFAVMQLYMNLAYGEISIKNARACIDLSQYYLNLKTSYLAQAMFHAHNAQSILEKLKLKPNNDHLHENLLGYDTYMTLIKCALKKKEYVCKTEIKHRNKHILSIANINIEQCMEFVEGYLRKLQRFVCQRDYGELNMKYLFLKFDYILLNIKNFNHLLYELIDQLYRDIEIYFPQDANKRKIRLYLRSGLYLISFEKTESEGLQYYQKAATLAEEEEKRQSSNENKHQLANVIFQRAKANIRTHHLTDRIEADLQRALQLYKDPKGDATKNSLQIIDELATFYIKKGQHQDALNILCETLSDKIRVFGEFSEELIKTEHLIGTIYQKEGECLNAVEHLKACLDIQEFVYGANDSETCKTRELVNFLKEDPMVLRTFFARTNDGKRQSRPPFRTTSKISHEKEDLELFQKHHKKPPMTPKN